MNERPSYKRSRALLLASGVLVLAALATFGYLRGVDKTEVAANVLFIPVFVALLFKGVAGGLVVGVLAAAAYVGLRYDDISVLGFGPFATQLAYRALAFPLFGLVGGWATKQLDASITKLELYDQVDDETGLFNARFLLQDTDLEMSRSKRYSSIFSIVEVDFPAETLEGMSRRRRSRVLRRLGDAVKDRIRTVDRGAHGAGRTAHRIAVVLPETGAEGASVFAGRFRAFVLEQLQSEGVPVTDDAVGVLSVTLPGDDEQLASMRERFAAIDRVEHPEPAAGAGKA